MRKRFSDELGIDETPELDIDKIKVIHEGIEKDYAKDYETIREVLLNAINYGEQLLELSLKRAIEDVTPRIVEAASASMRAITDSSEKLLHLHKNILELKLKILDREKASGHGEKEDKINSNLQDIVRELKTIKGENPLTLVKPNKKADTK